MSRSQRACPLCGVLVLRTHHCRASALVPTVTDPVTVQPALIEPLNDSTPPGPRARRRVANECPDHPGSNQRSWDCALCTAEAVPGQASALLDTGDTEGGEN